MPVRPFARGRDRVIARTAAPRMTTAQPVTGEQSASPRAVADQGFGGVFRAGRKEPALPPDQRRKRQLVGAERAPDAAFVESHAGYGDLGRGRSDYAAPSGGSSRAGGGSSRKCSLGHAERGDLDGARVVSRRQHGASHSTRRVKTEPAGRPAGVLLPLWEKVGREAGRMRGRKTSPAKLS